VEPGEVLSRFLLETFSPIGAECMNRRVCKPIFAVFVCLLLYLVVVLTFFVAYGFFAPLVVTTFFYVRYLDIIIV